MPTSLLTVLFAARFCAIFNTSVFIINIMPTFLGISLVGGGGGDVTEMDGCYHLLHNGFGLYCDFALLLN